MQETVKIGDHWLVQSKLNILGHSIPFSLHMDTLLTAWLAMLILISLCFVVTRKLGRVPDTIQVFAEMVMDFLNGITTGQIGKDGKKHIALIGSLFLFILVSNLLGQLPWKLYHLQQGELASPTNDLNVTAALALIVSVYYIGYGIYKKGLGYFKHYFEPLWFMAPLNIMEEFTKPLSLSVRLFGNILAGEVIILVLLTILPKYLFFMPLPMMLFELFVAFIQAFIFAVLAASYISAVSTEHHD